MKAKEVKQNLNINVVSNLGDAKNIGELKGLLAEARRLGKKAVIVSVPREMFKFDSAYQTPNRTNRDLTYLVKNWDDNKLLPVVGVPHDEEGYIYLVDGVGRWTASEIVDKEKYEYLECLVILNAPTEPKARQKFEAEQYAFQNKQVAKMTPLQRHGALEILGDPAVLAMNSCKKKYNFLYSAERGKREEGILGSYSETYLIAQNYGEQCLDYIFSICQAAGFDRKSNGYSTSVFRALRDMYRLYPNNRNDIAKFLGSYLRRYDPIKLKANSVTRYSMLDYKMAMSLYVEDLCVDNIGLSHKRIVEGKTVTEIKTA